MSLLSSLKTKAKELRQFTLIAYYAARDPRTPTHVRMLALFVAAYALSPIDLIPDFIPVLGYLDDLVLVPLGLALWLFVCCPHLSWHPPVRGRNTQPSGRPASWRPASLLRSGYLSYFWLDGGHSRWCAPDNSFMR
ncbi:Protein of unknown function [Nitrosomonas ureae]|uniref:DUF1232 domain-containing protein n=1 Tax=Nitrosomonas ureae TaxID=44577 RepID=A0A1H5XJC9_9PROT|nr:Protein of unknown function [Nitrosomonas ureae]